tara:strand:- start:459 stop:1517 length:1059 start_codon:yes stop_codon:yes gene_type:complete
MNYLYDISNWLETNTFQLKEFSNLKELETLKNKKGHTVSVVIPTLEEETTIEYVLRYLIDKLILENKIIDELVVMDGGSKDDTVTKILALQKEFPNYIKIYNQDDVLPGVCQYKGKGEALWKSLYVTNGDIVIYSDSDIKNFDERFIVGILGPLLVRDNIKFVKGYYERPLILSENIKSNEGGRVTELTARPLLNILYPQLSGFIQPLGGEYGGFRQVLENIEYTSGYGVEVQTLIETLETYGLESMAQTNLIERIHRHQPINALSKMSSAIMQTILRRKLDVNTLNPGLLIKNLNKENSNFVKSRTDTQTHCNCSGENFSDDNFKFALINEYILPRMNTVKCNISTQFAVE